MSTSALWDQTYLMVTVELGAVLNRAMLTIRRVTALLLIASPVLAQDTAVALVVDLEAETAKVTHTRAEPLDLGGWTLVSEEGGQTYTFPAGTRLAPGDTVTVTSGPDARDEPPAFLRWTGRHVWNNDGDPGQLLDREGNVVARSRGRGVAALPGGGRSFARRGNVDG